MKKVLKYTLLSIGVLFITALSLLAYVKFALPGLTPMEQLQIEVNSERVERGRYLANHVAVCIDCHSTRDWTKFSGPVVEGTLGAGGEKFGQEMGFPGNFYSPNITPYGIKSWSDGELFLAITSGVGKNGKALFPVMPYHNYGQLDKEDIYDIIAYIRTLEPVSNKVPPSEADFPVSLLINTMPKQAQFSERPLTDAKVKYGKYLVTMAGCAHCHSKTDKGQTIKGTELGGGMEFSQPAGIVRAPNITTDYESGIGKWTLADFIQSFKKYNDTGFHLASLEQHDLNSPMPWTMYAGMTEEDLEAIYIYLKSVPPIVNEVVRYEKRK